MRFLRLATVSATLAFSSVFAIAINNPKVNEMLTKKDQFICSRMKNTDGSVSIKRIEYDVGFFGPTQVLHDRDVSEDGTELEITHQEMNSTKFQEQGEPVASIDGNIPETEIDLDGHGKDESEGTSMEIDRKKRGGNVSFYAARKSGQQLHWKTGNQHPGHCVERILYRGQKANYLRWDVWSTDCGFVLYSGGSCKGKQVFNTNGYNVNSPGERYERPFESVLFFCR